ncbi:universal stress protein [Naumannella halotolerans]|uniref:universal stress protein n=1 Tax=Naumannella halotolerans TaxID=993414 RepID=UPI00370D0B90
MPTESTPDRSRTGDDEIVNGAVVVGVDGSEDSLRAVMYALREARLWDRELLIVHAVDDSILVGAWGVSYDPSVLAEAGAEVVEHSRDYAIEHGMPADRVRSEVFLGNPSVVMARLSENAWTVVVGRRAKSGLERLFVGSTSVSLASASQCPMIMVSAATNPSRTGDKHLVGVGIDNTERSREALAYAFTEAVRRQAGVQAVHAFEVSRPFFADEAQLAKRAAEQTESARRGAAELLAPFLEQYPEVPVEVRVERSHPVDELLARTREVDLLVLGVQGIGVPGLSPGGTIRAVMAHAEAPLALVRHARR